MSKTYRAGNGKFVRKDNPVAVIGRMRDQRERERAEMAAAAEMARRAAAEMARRAAARRNGYSGPLTRGELSAMLQGSAAS